MKFPTLFVNHGGGPLPLMGMQPHLAHHMQEAVKLLPSKPTSIVVLSAHWEADPVEISHVSGKHHLYFDYHGFPPETYNYQYPAPGNLELSLKVRDLLQQAGIPCKFDELSRRGLDHGVFVPLMLMYPNADIPVVEVSLAASLSAQDNIKIGRALSSLRDDGVLILGSGYTFHNMRSIFNPTKESIQASQDFNKWLKETLTISSKDNSMEQRLLEWTQAPGARLCHPREEHLIPLFMVAAASDFAPAKVIYDTTATNSLHGPDDMSNFEANSHGVTGFLFQ